MQIPSGNPSDPISIMYPGHNSSKMCNPDTAHRIYFEKSHEMKQLEDESVDLVVTSPPYPMISMWDDLFTSMSPEIGLQLNTENGWIAFDMMHTELDKTWGELYRVMRNGGLVCINVGDATRKVGNEFALYSSHSRITELMLQHGFHALTGILWRKPTNSPNKFMGSGMLPAGAYITLEHEHILVFRKGGKRVFATEKERENRRKSSYFWEERNRWFSDIWQDLKGASQILDPEGPRKRSAAFPIELPFRLINMFSVKGDTVLDPFLGTGTTSVAALMSQRCSIGYEMDEKLSGIIHERITNSGSISNAYLMDRVLKHREFVSNQQELGKQFKYHNDHLGVPVKERSEQYIELNLVKKVSPIEPGRHYTTIYEPVKPLPGRR